MIQEFTAATSAGIAAFVATNVDDIAILMLFFAKVDSNFRPRHIVAGQYLGFTGLILASLPGFFGGAIVPRPWLGWLGLIPIAIGIHQLFNRETDEPTIQTVSPARTNLTGDRSWKSRLTNILSPQTYQVAAVTFANGGDNIGIYVPLFARSNLLSLGVILGVFAIGIALWCFLAQQLTRQPLVAKALTNYGHQIVPFVLIGLGIFIFVDSGIYELFTSISLALLSN
ncbi:MAG: cadmium resistance transporter [Cyanosarcina radialis HA8281-LM2]|jgi:cadmium resistance transport/sequestration family protein|nr:cadmium resistance transporter [Cyanosarcina radialis HA8281-LM2]